MIDRQQSKNCQANDCQNKQALQSAGGAENNNVRNALLTIATGALISRAIGGPSATGPQTFSQRVTSAYFDRVAANVGYLYDVATNFIESLGPQKAQCSAPTN